MNMKSGFILCVGILLAQSSIGQVAYNSSVFNQSPSLFNVATTATGAADFGFCTNFKMQYLTMDGTPMRTNILSAEFKISDGSFTKNSFGIGFNALNEQTGENKLMSTQINVPVNYSMELSERAMLTIGVAPGVILQSYDPTSINWESDWNGSGFDWTIGDPIYINSTLSRSSYGAFNVNSGAYYQYSTRNKTRFFGGLAVNHLNKPKMNFSENGDKMYMQMLVHAGADLTTRKRYLRIQPQIMAFKTGPSTNLIFGVNLENILSSGSDYTNIVKSKSIGYGVNYRWKDAVSVNFNYKFQYFRVGFAVDATVSRLSSATNGLGSIEFFLKSNHLYGKKKNKVK